VDEHARLLDVAKRAAATGRFLFTDFLDPAQRDQARKAAREAGTQVAFQGGFPDAERVIARFGQEGAGEWPFQILRLSWNLKFGSPGHRDILGATMALGVKREAVGDILLQENTAFLALHDTVASYVRDHLTQAGRAALSVAWADSKDVSSLTRPMREVNLIVSSLRLDAVVAAAMKVSRAAAEKLILQGGVKVNHSPEIRPDKKLSEHCLISIQGYGRLYIHQMYGTTQRGRMKVKAERPE